MSDKETSLAFVERLEAFYGDNSESMSRLLRLAKTAALIDEHKMDLLSPYEGWSTWQVTTTGSRADEDADLHTAVRAVADKIKEQKA